mmetsp:Transcript_101136/g.291162  ORF Transcript_101136/g.291162 Transcript_101136/m.291162 type:complete len:290 (-) Transcript_101136:91-960(-)
MAAVRTGGPAPLRVARQRGALRSVHQPDGPGVFRAKGFRRRHLSRGHGVVVRRPRLARGEARSPMDDKMHRGRLRLHRGADAGAGLPVGSRAPDQGLRPVVPDRSFPENADEVHHVPDREGAQRSLPHPHPPDADGRGGIWQQEFPSAPKLPAVPHNGALHLFDQGGRALEAQLRPRRRLRGPRRPRRTGVLQPSRGRGQAEAGGADMAPVLRGGKERPRQRQSVAVHALRVVRWRPAWSIAPPLPGPGLLRRTLQHVARRRRERDEQRPLPDRPERPDPAHSVNAGLR